MQVMTAVICSQPQSRQDTSVPRNAQLASGYGQQRQPEAAMVRTCEPTSYVRDKRRRPTMGWYALASNTASEWQSQQHEPTAETREPLASRGNGVARSELQQLPGV